MTEPEPLQQLDRTYVLYSGRKLSYFSGCDYYRLSSHPQINRAAVDCLKKCGLSVSASRMTTGNHRLYGKLESELAQFFRAETTLLAPTGYAANLMVAQALSGQFSHALVDELSHPSLNDAAIILQCPILNFRHRSAPELKATAARCGPGSKLIVLTDGLFARDGSVAPLDKYRQVLPKDAVILVDDAHGAGVIGKNGRGSLDHTGVHRQGIIQTITLSKAFGSYGGAVLCTRALRARILKRSEMFIGSTPIPLPLAGAALQALLVLSLNSSLRKRLAANADYLRTGLQRTGLILPHTPGPILALTAKYRAAATKLNRVLLKAAILPPFIKYPGGPPAGFFRFVISSEHTPAQLDNLLSALITAKHLVSPLS